MDASLVNVDISFVSNFTIIIEIGLIVLLAILFISFKVVECIYIPRIPNLTELSPEYREQRESQNLRDKLRGMVVFGDEDDEEDDIPLELRSFYAKSMNLMYFNSFQQYSPKAVLAIRIFNLIYSVFTFLFEALYYYDILAKPYVEDVKSFHYWSFLFFFLYNLIATFSTLIYVAASKWVVKPDTFINKCMIYLTHFVGLIFEITITSVVWGSIFLILIYGFHETDDAGVELDLVIFTKVFGAMLLGILEYSLVGFIFKISHGFLGTIFPVLYLLVLLIFYERGIIQTIPYNSLFVSQEKPWETLLVNLFFIFGWFFTYMALFTLVSAKYLFFHELRTYILRGKSEDASFSVFAFLCPWMAPKKQMY